jgi:hypothetical protein
MTYAGKVLALDLAGKTGWAVGAPGEEPRHGSLRFAREGHSMGAHFAGCMQWLNDFTSVEHPRLVVFEAPLAPSFMTGRTNTDTARWLLGLCAVVEATLYGRGFDVREATVASVRNFFLGTNRIKSADAKLATKRRCVELGWMVGDDNAADACALWLYQCALLEPQIAVRYTPLFAALGRG